MTAFAVIQILMRLLWGRGAEPVEGEGGGAWFV